MAGVKRGDQLRALVVLLVYHEYYEQHGEIPRQADMFFAGDPGSLFDVKWRALGLHREYPYGVPSAASLYRALPLLRRHGLLVEPADGVSVRGGRPRVGLLTDAGREMIARLRAEPDPYKWPEIEQW